MNNEKQEMLTASLLGVMKDGKPLKQEHYDALSMEDLILLHHMGLYNMQNNGKDVKKKVFFAKRTGFFESLITLKLWALPECYVLTTGSNSAFYAERNEKTGDMQVFLFSNREGAQVVSEKLALQKKETKVTTIAHSQFPPIYLNMFSKGITAIVLDSHKNGIGLPLWTVCNKLKMDFVQEGSRPLVKTWIQKELYLLYATVTKMPYIECDPQTFDDQIFVFYTKEGAEAAVKAQGEKGLSLFIEKIENRDFYRRFFELYLIGANAMKLEDGTVIQLSSMVPKPDYSKLPEEKKPIANPELLLTAAYICQQERKASGTDTAGTPEASVSAEMKEELYAHLKESRLALPILVPEDGAEDGRVQFPMALLGNGEKYCPVFTDLQTARDFELSENEKFKKAGKEAPKYKYSKQYFDQILAMLPEEVHGISINPNTINLLMRKTKG